MAVLNTTYINIVIVRLERMITMINSQEEAFKFIMDRLQKGVFPSNSIKFNSHGHSIVLSQPNKYYVIFKRQPFEMFGKAFPQAKEQRGESVNEEVVGYAVSGNFTFLFVYPDGTIWEIASEKFRRIAKENEFIRKTATGEITYSVPMGALNRWF